RVSERVVVMAFGGEVHHRVVPGEQLVDEDSVADVAFHEPVAVSWKAFQRREIRGIAQLVDDSGGVIAVREQVAHAVAPDEPGTAGDEHSQGASFPVDYWRP